MLLKHSVEEIGNKTLSIATAVINFFGFVININKMCVYRYSVRYGDQMSPQR